MPYFIYFLGLACALVKTVGTIEDDTGGRADVLVGVNDAERDYDGFGIILADYERSDIIVGLRLRTVIP